MDKNRNILIFIFLAAFLLRLFLIVQTPSFSSDESYFILREVESIKETFFPISHDPLSYSGREYDFNPGYFYVLTLLDLILPAFIAFKVIPSLLATSLLFIVYLIVKELTRNSTVALFTSLVSAFLPLYFSQTLNSLTHYQYVIPLFFLALYFFLHIEKSRKHIYGYLAVLIIYALCHPSVLLLIPIFILYLIFLLAEKMEWRQYEFELILFSIFFIIWSQFILYKRELLHYGPSIIWQNIPQLLLSQHFVDFNIFTALSAVGIVPFVCGSYVIYKYVFQVRSKQVSLMIAATLIFLLLIWLKLIEFTIGLMFLSVLLVIFFGIYCKLSLVYLEKTKIPLMGKAFFPLLLILISVTSVVSCVYFSNKEIADAFTPQELAAMQWLKGHTGNESVVLASFSEGHIITAMAKRKNVIDSNFLMVDDIERRFDDLNQTFNAIYKTQAIALLNKYHVDYIYFSSRSRGLFNIEQLRFVDESCFTLVYNQSVQIYHSKCVLGGKAP